MVIGFAQLLAVLPAAAMLALMPGPNNLLSMHVAAARGAAAAWHAGLGRLLAFALLLVLAALGLAALLRVAPGALPLLQSAAALYLLVLARRLWVGVAPGPAGGAEADRRAALRREFWVALGNPKCLLIATAFVPQAVDPALPLAPQVVAVSTLVLLLEMLAIALYAGAGRTLQPWLAGERPRRRFGRACGLAMAGAALWLLARTWAAAV